VGRLIPTETKIYFHRLYSFADEVEQQQVATSGPGDDHFDPLIGWQMA
jgi:hypothetical protein